MRWLRRGLAWPFYCLALGFGLIGAAIGGPDEYEERDDWDDHDL